MDKREQELIAKLGIHINSLTSENEKLSERLQLERDFRDEYIKDHVAPILLVHS